MKLPAFLILTLTACAQAPVVAPTANSTAAPPRAVSSVGLEEYAAQKLLAKGVSRDFLDLIEKNFKQYEREKVLELNLLGFLQTNKPKGNEAIPAWELKRVKRFLHQHRRTFREAEQEFHVQREVIASLLWVETRHGRNMGHFHVASALYSLVEGDYPTLLDGILDEAKKKSPEYDSLMANRIQDHAHAKSDWAAGELVALQEIHEKGWKNATKLRGSFSGAFGMAQFMPSSYLAWAKSDHTKPNLFKADDSILSVANYLSSNGWQGEDRESQEGALYHYNRDKAYVAHILKMSACLRSPLSRSRRGKRSTASAPSC
jgi:membrane-bound lytic murein transglycosylase B